MLVVLSLYSNYPMNEYVDFFLTTNYFKANAYQKASDTIKLISFETTRNNSMGCQRSRQMLKLLEKPS